MHFSKPSHGQLTELRRSPSGQNSRGRQWASPSAHLTAQHTVRERTYDTGINRNYATVMGGRSPRSPTKRPHSSMTACLKSTLQPGHSFGRPTLQHNVASSWILSVPLSVNLSRLRSCCRRSKPWERAMLPIVSRIVITIQSAPLFSERSSRVSAINGQRRPGKPGVRRIHFSRMSCAMPAPKRRLPSRQIHHEVAAGQLFPAASLFQKW